MQLYASMHAVMIYYHCNRHSALLPNWIIKRPTKKYANFSSFRFVVQHTTRWRACVDHKSDGVDGVGLVINTLWPVHTVSQKWDYTVSQKWDSSHFCETVSLLWDSLTFLRQCGQAFTYLARRRGPTNASSTRLACCPFVVQQIHSKSK